MQGGGIGEKETRALEIFRRMTAEEKKLFLYMGWDMFILAGREAIIRAERRKTVEIIEEN